MWSQTPGATTAHDAKVGVEEICRGACPLGHPGSFGGREMGIRTQHRLGRFVMLFSTRPWVEGGPQGDPAGNTSEGLRSS